MRACLERICNSEMMRHTGTGGALMLSIAALQSVMKIAQGLQLHASSRELGSFDGPWLDHHPRVLDGAVPGKSCMRRRSGAGKQPCARVDPKVYHRGCQGSCRLDKDELGK